MAFAGGLALSYPGWQHDKEEAERIFVDHSISDRSFHEKLAAMRTKQRIHHGDRSSLPQLRALDSTIFDYPSWQDDKEEAERRLSGDCSVLKLGSYTAFVKKMLKKQSLSSDRSSIACLRELDGAHLTYQGWVEDKCMAEKIYVEYITLDRFYEKVKAMKNKQRLHENDRSHPDIVSFDNTRFTYDECTVDKQIFMQRHTGDCSVLQLGVSCDVLFQRMQKNQQIHDGSLNDDVLREMDSFPFTYPTWARDKETAERYYANFSSPDIFRAKFTAMKSKERLFNGDRSHPQIVDLDSSNFTYDGWELDQEFAFDVHTGDCTVLQLGTFEATLTKMKKKQRMHEIDTHLPGLCDLDDMLKLPAVGCDIKMKIDRAIHKSPEKCVVCLDEDASHAFMPCAHLCVCSGCVDLMEAAHLKHQHEVSRCPLCRQPTECLTRVIL